LCCRSLASKCGLKGGIGQNEDLVHANALEPSRQDQVRLHRARRASVRAQLPSSTRHEIERTPRQHVALAPSHSCLRHGILERLRALKRTTYDQAHTQDRQHINFVYK
jgi:hypothetical protein